jgi:Asp/Glu/hydantoin racemase
MLQTTELSYKLTQPLVTNMGLSYQSIVLSTAAKFLAFDSPEEAAQSMYETIEQSMSSKADAEESKNYFKMVMNNYLPTKP